MLSIIEMSSFPCWGGQEQHIKELATGLQKNGHKVLIVTKDIDVLIQGFSGVADIHVLPLRYALDWVSIRELAKLIKRENVDIVHTHCGRDSWIAIFATMVAGRGKVVRTRHGDFKVKSDIVHRWYFSRIAGIICVSEMVRKEFMQDNTVVAPDKVSVVYNGIDTERAASGCGLALRKEISITENEFLIGYVGRLTGEKGIEYLILATDILRKKYNNLKVLIVGDGPCMPILSDQVEKLGLDNIVYFYGFSKEVANVMQAIDVLVLPSTGKESFGLVLCEAMICGKPVVTTNTGAQREIVEDGVNGFLVSPASPEELAVALEKIILDKQLAHDIGENAEKTVIKKFSQQQMVRGIEEKFLYWLNAAKSM